MGGVRRVYQRRREYDRRWRHEGLLPPPVSPRMRPRPPRRPVWLREYCAARTPSKGTTMKASEAMEDALSLLAPTGPEYAGRLANHGPMAAQALVALERPDAVVPWVETYKKRLLAHPGGTRPIDPSGVARGPRRQRPRRRLDRALPRRARGASLEDRARGVDRAPLSGSRRRGFPRRDPHGPRGAQPRAAGDAGPRAGARRGTRVLGGDVQRTARNRRRPAKPPAGRKPSAAIAAVPILPKDKQISYGNITDRLYAARRVPAVRRSGRRRGSVGRPVGVHERSHRDLRGGVSRERDAGNGDHVPSRRDGARRRADASAVRLRRKSSAGSCATRGRPARRSPRPPEARPRRRRLRIPSCRRAKS